MKSINFDDGYKVYALNNDENNTVRICVTDFNMPARYEEAQKAIEKLVEEMKASKDPAPAKIKEFDSRIREQINYIFATDVCTPAFGDANCMSMTGGGKMLFEGFLEALINIVQVDMNADLTSAKYRIESKTDKYTKPVLSMSSADKGKNLTEEQKAYCRQLMEEMMQS